MKKTIFIYAILFLSFNLKAQDSIQIFSLDDLFTIILDNHPVAKQSELLSASAKQELLMTRGLLDPYIGSSFNQKEFESKKYYTLWDNYLKVPTWYGIDLKAGFEKNTGPYVSGENFTSDQGLTYIGISVPLGQGLFIDERRNQIKQAQQLPIIAEAEKIKIINKLLFQASKDYWDWSYCYNKWKLYKNSLTIASTRYIAVNERARLGDISSIDTVEALMQVQNFEVLVEQSEVEYRNTSLILSNYLWSEDEVPLELTGEIIPSPAGSEITPITSDSLNNLILSASENHPDLLKLNGKLTQLSIERKYQSDKFKPKVYVDYNFLHSDFVVNNNIVNPNYLSNNYKFGVSLSYPLFLRTERGKYQMTKLKIQDATYQVQQTSREIENNIRVASNDWMALERQILIQENLVKNSEKLLIGEQIRFDNGESSIFLINAREITLISNKIKLYEMKTKYAKSKNGLYWAVGSMRQ